jgi:hypothetical protein
MTTLGYHGAMITIGNLALVFDMVVPIARNSSYVGMRRLLKIKRFDTQ